MEIIFILYPCWIRVKHDETMARKYYVLLPYFGTSIVVQIWENKAAKIDLIFINIEIQIGFQNVVCKITNMLSRQQCEISMCS